MLWCLLCQVQGTVATVCVCVCWGKNNSEPDASLAEPLDMEDLSSGLGVTRQELGQGKGGITEGATHMQTLVTLGHSSLSLGWFF